MLKNSNFALALFISSPKNFHISLSNFENDFTKEELLSRSICYCFWPRFHIGILAAKNKVDQKMNIESNVRSYCRNFPVQFRTAHGSIIRDSSGTEYLDFLTGCGSLNYGHNHSVMKDALIAYVTGDGIAHGLDLETEAKKAFLDSLDTIILQPRGLQYVVQFPGPTGANAVEAAIKIARKVTGRTNIVAFTNGFHGCSLGALSLTGSSFHRGHSAPLLNGVTRMPFDRYFGDTIDTFQMIRQMIDDPSGGIDLPAAIILETIQGEGGLNVASKTWVKNLTEYGKSIGALIIIDEIQAGCGRSGDFFSFEKFDISPDIIVLAKSISGFGLPLSLVLLKPQYDQWEPGEHNGTFRGNNHAFVTANAALEHFWRRPSFAIEVKRKIDVLSDALRAIADRNGLIVRGRGMMQGLDMVHTQICSLVRQNCFENGVILEASGPRDQILKLLPALTITDEELARGLSIIHDSIDTVSIQKISKIEGKKTAFI